MRQQAYCRRDGPEDVHDLLDVVLGYERVGKHGRSAFSLTDRRVWHRPHDRHLLFQPGLKLLRRDSRAHRDQDRAGYPRPHLQHAANVFAHRGGKLWLRANEQNFLRRSRSIPFAVSDFMVDGDRRLP